VPPATLRCLITIIIIIIIIISSSSQRLSYKVCRL